MLHELHSALAGRGISLRIIGAHGTVRDLLRADGLGEKTDGIDRLATLEEALRRDAKKSAMERPLSRPRSPI
jgi:hypothetical protein